MAWHGMFINFRSRVNYSVQKCHSCIIIARTHTHTQQVQCTERNDGALYGVWATELSVCLSVCVESSSEGTAPGRLGLYVHTVQNYTC